MTLINDMTFGCSILNFYNFGRNQHFLILKKATKSLFGGVHPRAEILAKRVLSVSKSCNFIGQFITLYYTVFQNVYLQTLRILSHTHISSFGNFLKVVFLNSKRISIQSKNVIKMNFK